MFLVRPECIEAIMTLVRVKSACCAVRRSPDRYSIVRLLLERLGHVVAKLSPLTKPEQRKATCLSHSQPEVQPNH